MSYIFLFWPAPFLYVVAFFGLLLKQLFPQISQKKRWPSFLFFLAALVVHFLTFSAHLFKQEYPYLTSVFETYQLLSLLVAILSLILWTVYRFWLSVLILLPLILLLQGLSLYHLSYHLPSWPITHSSWALAHLLFMFVSMSLMLASFVSGLLFVWQERAIKLKKPNRFLSSLPPLQTLERLHLLFLKYGFILFTLGIMAGAGWSKMTTGLYVSNSFKQSFSFGVWGYFAFDLWFLRQNGWRGKRGVTLSLIGLAGMIILLMWVQGLNR